MAVDQLIFEREFQEGFHTKIVNNYLMYQIVTYFNITPGIMLSGVRSRRRRLRLKLTRLQASV